MAIYTLIRDWFVQYIFGGYDSTGAYFGAVINLDWDLNDIEFYVGDNAIHIGLGDWLSTTATLVVLVLLVFALGCLVVGLFRLFRGLFALRG